MMIQILDQRAFLHDISIASLYANFIDQRRSEGTFTWSASSISGALNWPTKPGKIVSAVMRLIKPAIRATETHGRDHHFGAMAEMSIEL